MAEDDLRAGTAEELLTSIRKLAALEGVGCEDIATLAGAFAAIINAEAARLGAEAADMDAGTAWSKLNADLAHRSNQ